MLMYLRFVCPTIRVQPVHFCVDTENIYIRISSLVGITFEKMGKDFCCFILFTLLYLMKNNISLNTVLIFTKLWLFKEIDKPIYISAKTKFHKIHKISAKRLLFFKMTIRSEKYMNPVENLFLTNIF